MMLEETAFINKNNQKSDLPDDTLLIVYSIGNSGYQEWQADLLDFSFAALINQEPSSGLSAMIRRSPEKFTHHNLASHL